MPIDPSLMTRWRKRIGPDVLVEVSKATVAIALETGTVKPSSLEGVTVDTNGLGVGPQFISRRQSRIQPLNAVPP